MASYFTKYRHLYKEPERYSPEIARERRLAATLAKEQVLNDERAAALSQVKIKTRTPFVPAWKAFDERQSNVHKAASIAAALSQFKERDFADPEKRSSYRELRAQQEYLRQVNLYAEQARTREGGQRKVNITSGSDMRRFMPDREDVRTSHGTIARVGLAGLLGFVNPFGVIPCIQRQVRKEVLFALGKSGKGYHTRKRRSYSSEIPC